MRHIISILSKWIMLIGILYVVLAVFFGVTFMNVLGIATLLTLLGYPGDLYVLRKLGNVIATIGDAGLTFIAVWFLADTLFESFITQFYASLSAAIVVAFGEVLFHWTIQAIDPLSHTQSQQPMNKEKYSTEFGEDFSERQDKE